MKVLYTFILALYLFPLQLCTEDSTNPGLCIKHLPSLNYEVDVNGSVADVRVLPTRADLLLQKQAPENIRQWTFFLTARQKFNIRYKFRLVEPEISGWSPSAMSVDFPARVRVTCNFAPIYKD